MQRVRFLEEKMARIISFLLQKTFKRHKIRFIKKNIKKITKNSLKF